MFVTFVIFVLFVTGCYGCYGRNESVTKLNERENRDRNKGLLLLPSPYNPHLSIYTYIKNCEHSL